MLNEITTKETFNLIQGLKAMKITDSQIVKLFEFVESSDPDILEQLENTVILDDND